MANNGFTRVLLSVVLCIGVLGVGRAQLRIPKADLTPGVETDPIRAGGEAILSLKVELDDTLHVQSDKPRDKLLIPTALSLSPPEGVTVEKITYPPAEDFTLTGSEEPLAVFPHEFTIEVRLAVGPGIDPGQVTVGGRLQYQACDETACFPPTGVDTSWALTITEP